jgi:pSer/pThr/pTyr-binding forkhead associated (FHA) protein
MPKIQFTTTDGTTGEYELNQERMSVGRADDNHIVIPDGSVSSHHGEFTFDGSSWAFTDTGSTNGTKIGGERVESIPLYSNTGFVMGSVECAFISDEAASSGASESQASWEAEESPPSRAASFSASSSGSRAINRSARVGFGPHKKAKDASRTMLMLLGVVGCLACLAAIFISMKMGA